MSTPTTTRPSEGSAAPRSAGGFPRIPCDLSTCELRLQHDLLALAAEREAAGGGALSPAEIAELYARREDVGRAYAGGGHPDTGSQGGLLPRQLQLCPGVTLYSPTMAVQTLLEIPYDEHWDVAGAWYDRYTAYLLAHAFNPDALRAVTLQPEARRIIRQWSVCLVATQEQLQAAVRQLITGATPSEILPADSADPADPAKKNAATPPAHSASWLKAPAAPPTTGSTKSPRATPPGCSARSSASTASVRRPPPKPAAPASPLTPTPASAPPPPTVAP